MMIGFYLFQQQFYQKFVKYCKSYTLTFSVSTHFTSLVCVSQFYSQVLLTSLMFSFLMSSLLFRESKADVEAPVFPMESAVVSARSKCQQITRRSHRGRIRIKQLLYFLIAVYCFVKIYNMTGCLQEDSHCCMLHDIDSCSLQFSAKLCIPQGYIPAESLLWSVQRGWQHVSVCLSR